MRSRKNAETSHFDLARKVCWRRGEEVSIVLPLDPHLIVGHKPRLEARLRWKRDKAEREV
jgi:hypothetical protein